MDFQHGDTGQKTTVGMNLGGDTFARSRRTRAAEHARLLCVRQSDSLSYSADQSICKPIKRQSIPLEFHQDERLSENFLEKQSFA